MLQAQRVAELMHDGLKETVAIAGLLIRGEVLAKLHPRARDGNERRAVGDIGQLVHRHRLALRQQSRRHIVTKNDVDAGR